MLKILKELCVTKEMASFYSNYEKTDSFHVGTVLAVNDEEIALKLVSPYGEDDGVEVFNVEDIFRVETEGKYLEKIKKLCTDSSVLEFNKKINESSIIESILTIACDKKEMVSVELIDSGYTEIQGFVESVSGDECKFRQVDDYGYEDGVAYVKICNVTQVSYARTEERRVLKLWKMNKQ